MRPTNTVTLIAKNGNLENGYYHSAQGLFEVFRLKKFVKIILFKLALYLSNTKH
jgi:hypothetical protein